MTYTHKALRSVLVTLLSTNLYHVMEENKAPLGDEESMG